ncbi:MAG: glycosyl transferase family 2 [Frankiales bacterium]|nr:glycosyl transferase family 2 [Frankiales bacterium]
MTRVLVVVPCFNEQASVGRVVAEVKTHLPEADVLVVDDCSSDGTLIAAQAAGAEVVSLCVNLGVGGAMRVGYRYADEHGYDVVLQVDGDGQHDSAVARPLLDAVANGADLVIGARFAGTGDYDVRGPRRWSMRLLAAVLSRRTGVRLTDTTSGFRAASPRATRLFARHYAAEYLGDTIEAIVLASKAGLVIEQVPVAMRARTTGRPSAGSWRAVLYLGRVVLALVLSSVRRFPSQVDA